MNRNTRKSAEDALEAFYRDEVQSVAAVPGLASVNASVNMSDTVHEPARGGNANGDTGTLEKRKFHRAFWPVAEAACILLFVFMSALVVRMNVPLVRPLQSYFEKIDAGRKIEESLVSIHRFMRENLIGEKQ